MPRLDPRLQTVARHIRCRTHVDIGSDHGHLLKALLASGRIERGIAVENKTQPHANSSETLAGYRAEVRFSDGLDGVAVGEAECLSICGMGGRSMTRILQTHPDRVPPTVILQPNCKPEFVRRWGLQAGYLLTDETFARGHWRYVVLRFQRSEAIFVTDGFCDPAYAGIDREAAILFGPRLIRDGSDELVDLLHEELGYLRSLDRLGNDRAGRLATIERLLGEMNISESPKDS